MKIAEVKVYTPDLLLCSFVYICVLYKRMPVIVTFPYCKYVLVPFVENISQPCDLAKKVMLN